MDIKSSKWCEKRKNKGKCTKPWIAKKCLKTCEQCENEDSNEDSCEDIKSSKWCEKRKNKGKCSKKWVAKNCQKTCGECNDDSNPGGRGDS